MTISTIYRGVQGNSSAQFALGDAFTTAQNNDDSLNITKPERITNVAALRLLDKTKINSAETNGYYTAGDGGAGEYWLDDTDTTSADNGFTVIVAADGGRWKLQPVNGKYNVRQAGAVGDGIADDTVSARNAHIGANSNNCQVSYLGIDKIAIQANAQIPMKTSTDFSGCEIVVLGGVESPPTYSTFNTMFIVSDDVCPLVTVSGAISSANLTKGAVFPTLGLFDGHGYALLSCAYQVPNRAKTGTQDYVQSFKINRNGRASYPLSTDLTAFAADITVKYRKTSIKKLTISNVAVTEGAWNNQILFNIQRCNVKVEGVTLLFSGAGADFYNICQIIKIEDSSDVVINDFVTTGRPVTTTVGSYCLDVEGGADIFVNRMNALTGWGATGCNNINGMRYSDCVLNRIDVHASAHNVFAGHSTIQEAGMVYGWGGGVLSVKNCKLIRCVGIANRPDYGGTFFGDLIVSNCEVNNNFTSTYRLIDLETNPLGASTDVYAPQTITASNIRRVGKSSGSNAEFIPIAVKIRGATDVVYSPSSISVSNIGCHPIWRFGLRVDSMNMEANPLTTITRVTVDNVPADAAATSTTGILDFTSIRTPTIPVRPNFKLSNCENVHLKCGTLANLQIIADNCTLNGVSVDTGSATQPLVSIKNSRFITAATGYTNAPVGGGVSGTGGHTILENCEIANVAFDMSLVAAAIGNTIRTGGTPPLLPGAATATTFFTGYRQAGVFL